MGAACYGALGAGLARNLDRVPTAVPGVSTMVRSSVHHRPVPLPAGARAATTSHALKLLLEHFYLNSQGVNEAF